MAGIEKHHRPRKGDSVGWHVPFGAGHQFGGPNAFGRIDSIDRKAGTVHIGSLVQQITDLRRSTGQTAMWVLKDPQ